MTSCRTWHPWRFLQIINLHKRLSEICNSHGISDLYFLYSTVYILYIHIYSKYVYISYVFYFFLVLQLELAQPAFGFGTTAAAQSSVSGVFGSSGAAGSTGSGVFGSGSTGGGTTGFGQSASTPAFGSLTASTTGTTPFGSGSGKSLFIRDYCC